MDRTHKLNQDGAPRRPIGTFADHHRREPSQELLPTSLFGRHQVLARGLASDQSFSDEFDGRTYWNRHDDLYGFREEWSTHDYIGLDLLNSHIDLANHFQGVRERKTLF